MLLVEDSDETGSEVDIPVATFLEIKADGLAA